MIMPPLACCSECGRPYPQGRIYVDLANREVVVGDRRLGLTPNEAEILSLLAIMQPRLVPYSTIIEDLWQGRLPKGGAGHNIKVYLCMLRRKLKPLGIGIKTHYGEGARLVWLTEAAKPLLPMLARRAQEASRARADAA